MFNFNSNDNIILDAPKKLTNEEKGLITPANKKDEMGLINAVNEAPGAFHGIVGDNIAKYLSLTDLKSVAKTCRFFSTTFESEVNKRELLHNLLEYGVYATKNDLEVIDAILSNIPRLLLQRGDVQDLAGNWHRNVTLYEFFLGAGDYEAADIVASHFKLLGEKGEIELAKQYAKYEPFINNMLKEPVYDFNNIVRHILSSSPEIVKEALLCNYNDSSSLHTELARFRKYFAPREITKGMHFNSVNLLAALRIYDAKYDNLSLNPDNLLLFWRQVIGFLQRRLSACDRQVWARGTRCMNQKGVGVDRSFTFKFAKDSFPPTLVDKPETIVDKPDNELGYQWAVRPAWAFGCPLTNAPSKGTGCRSLMDNFILKKQLNLQALCPTLDSNQSFKPFA